MKKELNKYKIITIMALLFLFIIPSHVSALDYILPSQSEYYQSYDYVIDSFKEILTLGL